MDNIFVVIRAGKEMLPDIAAIEEVCFSHPWSPVALEGELVRSDARIFCALERDTVAAYGSMRMVLDEASIGNIACLPDFRGRGAGGQVLDALIACAKEAGMKRMLLEVRPSNTAAIVLYRSRGFVELGRRKGFYRDPTEDALMMEKIP